MSTIDKGNGTNCLSPCDAFASRFPKIARSSGCVARYATITAIACLIMATAFYGISAAMNPQFCLSTASFNQVLFYSVNLATGILAIITACFLDNVHQSYKEQRKPNEK